MDGDSRESLEAEIAALWGQISAATYRFLELLARYDREGGWQHHGLADCAQWLNWQCGIGPVAAREKLWVARALEGLPKISDAMRRGELSYSRVRALSQVAKPETGDDLLNIARHGAAVHVETDSAVAEIEDGPGISDDGVLVFTASDGRRIPPGAPCAPGASSASYDASCAQTHERFRGIIFDAMPEIGADMIRSRWQGETLDYSLAIEGMVYREQRAAAP